LIKGTFLFSFSVLLATSAEVGGKRKIGMSPVASKGYIEKENRNVPYVENWRSARRE
jgi:hypothetical protein